MAGNILSLLGLCRKAGMLELGEEPVEAAARAKDARVLLLAQDAADNTVRRVRHFAEMGECVWLRIPFTKDELGRAVGRTSCAILAVTDIGFAHQIALRLAAEDPAQYGGAAEKLALKAKRAAERKAEMEAHEKNVRTGKVRKKPRPAEKTPDGAAKAGKAATPSGAIRRPGGQGGKRPPSGEGYRRTDARPGGQSGGKRPSREERARSRAKVHPMDRFRNSRPVKKGKGSARSKREAQP